MDYTILDRCANAIGELERSDPRGALQGVRMEDGEHGGRWVVEGGPSGPINELARARLQRDFKTWVQRTAKAAGLVDAAASEEEALNAWCNLLVREQSPHWTGFGVLEQLVHASALMCRALVSRAYAGAAEPPAVMTPPAAAADVVPPTDGERTYTNVVYRGEPGPGGTVTLRSERVSSKEMERVYLEKGWHTDPDHARRATPLDPSPQVLIEQIRNDEQQRRQRQAARERRDERLEQALNRLLDSAAASPQAVMTPPADAPNEPHVEDETAVSDLEVGEVGDAEVDGRQRMLEDYITATGVDKVRAICRGAKVDSSGFYDWKNGKLLRQSKTSKRIERFLIAKRPPPEPQ